MDFHLLIIDDDERIRSLLQKFLIKNGFMVSTCRDASHARRILDGLEFDLIILDIMMPGEDGISLTKSLREKLTTPILLLSARGDTDDRIVGLEAGADDYISKPFEPKELLLRIQSILRRIPQTTSDKNITPKSIRLGHTYFDVTRTELWQGDRNIRLTATETQLMRIFAAHLGTPVSRTQLAQELGKDTSLAQDRAIDVQITRLRRKIEKNPKEPRYLQTVRGSGYMLTRD